MMPARGRAAPQVALNFDDPAALLCGVDEVGRGPLAGPVVAAAIIFDATKPSIRGLADSKVLSPVRREELYEKIVSRALAFCVASASVEEIDSINILHATMLAMQRAVLGLGVVPGLVKVDGNRCPVLPMRSEAVIGGDATVPLISAASILAKVVRDRMLADFHEQHPEYGFAEHAGYSTPQHLAALRQHGPCIHHRHSFEPVRIACNAFGVTVREYATRGAPPDDRLIKGGVLLRGGSFVPGTPEVVALPGLSGAPLAGQTLAHETLHGVSCDPGRHAIDSREDGSA